MIKVKSTLWKFAMLTHWGTYCTDEGGEIGRGFTVVVSMKDREGQEDVTEYAPQVVKQIHRNYNITVKSTSWFEESTKSQLNSWFMEIFTTYGMKENLVKNKTLPSQWML